MKKDLLTKLKNRFKDLCELSEGWLDGEGLPVQDRPKESFKKLIDTLEKKEIEFENLRL